MRRFVFVCLAAVQVCAWAREPLIEEILVSAQRVEQNVQRVPIAVTALTESALEDRQIVTFGDLKSNVPNFNYVPNNFGGAQLTIRGIGELYGGEAGKGTVVPSAPIHLNGISIPVDISVTEFYDVERLEVSRGPQGTLYGRNATAGAINVVTRRPTFERFDGYVDLELGDYDHRRVRGAVNVPLGERAAIRAAGLYLERDGYIENVAADVIDGVDSNIDAREMHSFRITAEAKPTDRLSLWLSYSRFDESDSRVRISNQVCVRGELPAVGCDPNEFGLEPPREDAVNWYLFGVGTGLLAFGAVNEDSGLVYRYPRPPLDIRQQHTDMTPDFEAEEDVWLLGVEWQLENYDVQLNVGYTEMDRFSAQDYLMDVGPELLPSANNPEGIWPTSAVPREAGAIRDGGPCDLESGGAGILGGCVLNDDLSRVFAYDAAVRSTEFFTAEARLSSKLPGRFNFLVGANALKTEVLGSHTIASNMMDAAPVEGGPFFGLPPVYPSLFNNDIEQTFDSRSIFGELYFDLSERLRLTAGLRYNHDEKENRLIIVNINAWDVATLDPSLGTSPVWVREPLVGYVLNGVDALSEQAAAIGEYYGATDAIASAVTPQERLSAAQLVPITPRSREFAEINGIPTEGTWDGFSGRIGLDWNPSDDAMVYLFYTQGYRPGGVNLIFGSDAEYDSERVHAMELGAKTRWLDGRLQVNSAVFYNWHDDLHLLQQSAIGTTTIANVDAESYGFELETVWIPQALPSLAVEFEYAYLHSEYADGLVLNPLDRAQGDSGLVVLKDFPGMGTFVAPIDEVLPLVDDAIAGGWAFPTANSIDENGIPNYMSSGALAANGVAVSSGIPANLEGNELPNSPPHSLRLGLAHTWNLGLGALNSPIRFLLAGRLVLA